MVRTSERTEETINLMRTVFKTGSKPKYVLLRLLIMTSLSKRKVYEDFDVASFKMDGSEYKLVQVTGYGKDGDEDLTSRFRSLLESFLKEKITTNKALEKELEFHVARGTLFYENLMIRKSNPFVLISEILNIKEGA